MNTVSVNLTIGAVAKRVGVAIDTIRYYERQGLLPEPQRRASGYRSYGESSIVQLHFIRRAKTRLAAIDARMAELQRVRDGLAQLVESCPGHGALEHCPILRALTDTVHA